MKINELSKQSGIHLETIRYYEKMGLMPEPKRLAWPKLNFLMR